MSLRIKTLAVIVVTVLSTCMFFYLVTNTLIFSSFAKLEDSFTRQLTERSVAFLDDDLRILSSIADDWASWDDTYAFIEDANPKYISSNLVSETLSGLRLNLMIFIDNDGKIIASKSIDL
jgi:sensor domain CHASE-containing protein